MRAIAVILILCLLTCLLPVSAMAEEVTIKSIDPSPYYDSQPRVYGNHVTWRRAINQNANEYIELNEPSWIMAHNLETGKTWNVTPANKVMGGTVFYHAQSPDISGDRIVYEAQTGLNSSDTKLFLYNISQKKTWELPIRSTSKAQGHLHCMSGNWVAYTNYHNGSRQAYLYNYQDGIYRTILGINDGNTTYGMVMSKDYVVITMKNESNVFSILAYNIGSGHKEMITDDLSRIMLATTTSGKNIGIISKNFNGTEWSTRIYRIGTGFTKSYDSKGILIWGDSVAISNGDYISFLSSDSYEWAVINGQNQRLGDIYKNNIVWSDNENSEALHGDARDNYDIYIRTVITDKEIFIEWMWLVLVIVAIIIALVILRIKVYSANER